MDKLQIDKKLIIDVFLLLLLIIGSIMHVKNVPGGLLIVVFSSIIWSLLLLFGAFYLFKSRKFDSNNILGVLGLFLFILPLSYSFQVFDYPGDILVLFYSIVTIPVLGALYLTLYFINRRKKHRSYYMNMIIRMVVLFLMCSISMIFTAPRL